MKWLFTAVLWTLAVIVALAVLWRLYRGKPIILRGKLAPRVIRVVAVLLVMFGLGADRTEAAPVPVDSKKGKVDEELPPTITQDVLEQWHTLHHRDSQWTHFKQLYTLLIQRGEKPTQEEMDLFERRIHNVPQNLTDLLRADVRALGLGKAVEAPTPRQLIAALDEAETYGYLDAWLTAYLWRKTAGMDETTDRKALVTLMARLHRHARLSNAIITCQFQVRPIMEPPVVWRGKGGGPPRGWNPQAEEQARLQAALVRQLQGTDWMKTMKSAYAKADIGTWQKDALTLFGIEKGSCPVTVIRGGEPGMPLKEGGIRLGRLDLLETTPGDKPALLLHPILGRIELPAGKLVSIWDLPNYLSDKSRDALKQFVKDALAGQEKAAQQLELMLPLAHSFMREALKATPAAEGAPRLRLILTQFDDVPMTIAREPQPMFPGGVPFEGGLPPGARGGRGGFDR